MSDSFVEIIPNPVLMVKSIAEQGYNLETAIADLLDNSITAKATKISIISIPEEKEVIIADNGNGMNKDTLLSAMKMPSECIDTHRDKDDLGRFGLGLKTASFSQARSFVVISKAKGTLKYFGYKWDVDILIKKKGWLIEELSDEEVLLCLRKFHTAKKGRITCFEKEELPSTIIIWQKLFKISDYNQLINSLQNDVCNHLSLIFHRFLEGKLNISVDNNNLEGFNPFNNRMHALQQYSLQETTLDSLIRIQGFTLSLQAIQESKQGKNDWTYDQKSLSDLEGIYIYRENRIIYYGGWPRLLRRKQHLKLARLKVELTNEHDFLFHINVAKAKFDFPKKYLVQFKAIASELDESAYRVYYNNSVGIVNKNTSNNTKEIFNKEVTAKGLTFSVNPEGMIYKQLLESLKTTKDKGTFILFVKKLLRMLNHYANLDTEFGQIEKDHKNELSLDNKQILRDLGFSEQEILNF